MIYNLDYSAALKKNHHTGDVSFADFFPFKKFSLPQLKLALILIFLLNNRARTLQGPKRVLTPGGYKLVENDTVQCGTRTNVSLRHKRTPETPRN